MGWNIGKALGSIYGGPVGMAIGALSGGGGKARSYESPDPYSVQWDPRTGMPIGLQGPPGAHQARAYQYRAMEMARQRRESLWGSAEGAVRGGMNLFQSYRPGGAASLAAGLQSQLGSMYAAHAGSITEPDMGGELRRYEQEQANRAAERAQQLGAITGLFQAGAGILGTIAGGPVGGAAASAAAGALTGGAGGAGAGTSYSSGYNPSSGANAQAGSGSYSSAPPGGLARAPAPGGAGAAAGGFYPAGTGPAPDQGARMARAGSPGSSPPGGHGAAGPGPGGPAFSFGSDGHFSQTALAASGMAGPGGTMADTLAMENADTLEMGSTKYIVTGARARLIEAIYG